MIMKTYLLRLLISLSLLLMGCSSLLRPKSLEPVNYQLQYPAEVIACSHSFKGGLRVRRFTTSVPFNRTQIVVLKDQGQVVFSRNFQWVDIPGIMISEKLERDLSRSALFEPVVSSMHQVDVPFELSGHLQNFSCKRTGSKAKALFEAQISLHQIGPKGKILFHKSYSLQSDSFQGTNSSRFVQEISSLSGRFSDLLQEDLCNLARQLSNNR